MVDMQQLQKNVSVFMPLSWG